jgi:XXXCH domain-containing protein
MGLKVEKRFSRQELADFLADLSRQVQSGQLQGENRAWTVPEQVEANIHLKEEDGEVVTKIKLRWPARGAAPRPAREMGPLESISFKEVKSRLSAPFKELQRRLQEGIIPDSQTVQDFVENSHLFANLGKPGWQELMTAYMAQVEKLQQAVTDGRLEAIQQEFKGLVERMSACHREFKK